MKLLKKPEALDRSCCSRGLTTGVQLQELSTRLGNKRIFMISEQSGMADEQSI